LDLREYSSLMDHTQASAKCVSLTKADNGFGFTLRHFLVYPNKTIEHLVTFLYIHNVYYLSVVYILSYIIFIGNLHNGCYCRFFNNIHNYFQTFQTKLYLTLKRLIAIVSVNCSYVSLAI